MRKILASRYPKWSVIFAVVWIGVFWSIAICYAIVELFVLHGRLGLFILILTTIVTLLVVWGFITHNKEISFDQIYLYVRTRKAEVKIPLSQVSAVYYNFLLKRVVIKLESKTPFGGRITFPKIYEPGIFGLYLFSQTREFVNDLRDNVNSFKDKSDQVAR